MTGNKLKVQNNSGVVVGGDHAGSINQGSTYEMSGDFRGAILNIESTLTNVSQRIATLSNSDDTTKAQLQSLIETLSVELQKVPETHVSDAEAVSEIVKTTVDHATKEQPNKTLVHVSAEGLIQAANNLATVVPTILPIVTQIVQTLRAITGS